MAKTTTATTTDPTTSTPATAKAAKPPTETTMSFRADGMTLTLVAHRLRDGRAETYARTRDEASKKIERGMTETHSSFEAAATALTLRAAQAEKLGWTRRVPGRGFLRKRDAFATLPAAPKAPAKTPKR